jgi:hypothetical protein
LLGDAVVRKCDDNPEPNKEPGKSGLSYSEGLKSVATFAVPIFIIFIILKLAGC